MVFKTLLFGLSLILSCLSQGLPDREDLTKKFLQPATSAEGAQALIENFQLGGVRTIIRNLSGLPPETMLQYGNVLRHMDLMRFRNDLNANLEKAAGPEEKAFFLMLLATIGRALDPATFEPYMSDEMGDIRVRLAAAGAIIKVQNPKKYDRFLALANKAVVDPGTGQNDLAFADISQKNRGFFLYTRSKLDQGSVEHGAIVSALAMAEKDSEEIYDLILGLRKKKYIPMMIDRAVQVGGTALLEKMASHKAAKKFRSQVNSAIPAARAIGQYRDKFMDHWDMKKYPMGSLVPMMGSGSSGSEGFRASYAVVKISAQGQMSAVTDQSPFGASANLNAILAGVTLPAYLDWQAVESYALVVAP